MKLCGEIYVCVFFFAVSADFGFHFIENSSNFLSNEQEMLCISKFIFLGIPSFYLLGLSYLHLFERNLHNSPLNDFQTPYFFTSFYDLLLLFFSVLHSIKNQYASPSSIFFTSLYDFPLLYHIL